MTTIETTKKEMAEVLAQLEAKKAELAEMMKAMKAETLRIKDLEKEEKAKAKAKEAEERSRRMREAIGAGTMAKENKMEVIRTKLMMGHTIDMIQEETGYGRKEILDRVWLIEKKLGIR